MGSGKAGHPATTIKMTTTRTAADIRTENRRIEGNEKADLGRTTNSKWLRMDKWPLEYPGRRHARQNAADKVEMLRRQQAELATRLKEAETKAREKKRDDEQRRERLAGRCVLAQLDQEPDSAWSRSLLALLDRAVKRQADRALFPTLAAAVEQTVQDETAQDGSGEAAS